MVVNAKGRAVTQRVEPSLALVEAELPPEAFAADDWQPASDSHMGTAFLLYSISSRIFTAGGNTPAECRV
jgi:hypothetical protein